MTPTDYAFVAVAASDLAAADATLDLLWGLESSAGLPTLDVVSIGRKRSGEVRFHREPALTAGAGSRVSIAAGLAAALYPSVGADQPSSRAAERAMLSAVAGQVGAALGRAALLEFGEVLDAASAAVILVCPVARRAEVVGLLADSDHVVVRAAALEPAALERAAQAASSATSPRTARR